MKRIILEIGDSSESAGPRYLYNLWSVMELEDGSLQKDARIIHSDNLDQFLEELGQKIKVPTIGEIKARLEYLRAELRAERMSHGELFELQSLIPYIGPDDVELLEAAGVPEKE